MLKANFQQMQHFHVISEIFRSRWLLEPAFAHGMLPIVQKLVDGHTLSSPDWGKEARSRFATLDGGAIKDYAQAAPGSVAHIAIEGPVMRADGLCSMGMATMGKLINQANSAENISAIVLEFNTPGGSVTGTQELANIIKASQKPVYAFVHFACSAGYWLASACKEIWASSATAEVGSIGVMSYFLDRKDMLKEAGITEHEIYASQSADKNKTFREARNGNYELMIKEELNPLAEIFQADMRANRNLPNEAMTGKTYLAEPAMKLGMIDRIGSLEDLKKHIQGNSLTTTNTPNMAEGTFMQRLAAKLAGKNTEEAQAEALASQINELETSNNALTQQLADQNALIEQKNKRIEQLLAELDAAKTAQVEAEERAEAFGKQPGALPTASKKIGGDVVQHAQAPDPDEVLSAYANSILK